MNSFPFDIASRASNLSERIQLVTTLNSCGGKAFPNTMLTAFDRWKIDTLAQKLTGRSFCERVNRGTDNRAYLTSILTAHRLYEVGLGHLEADQKDLLAEIHREWLPTYQRALHHFERAEISEAFWYKPELYYGQFARVCEPFLVQIQRELQPVCLHANTSSSINLHTSQLIEDMQKTLLQRFELALAWATEVEANVYCARYQINKAQATTEDYIAFLNETFLDSASYHRFYLHFPLLGRWLAQGTRFLIDNGRMLIERLCHDSEEIAPIFFGQRITSVLSFTAGTSDYHARGQYVMLVDVELEAFFGEEVRFSGSLWYPPLSYRLWHTNETQAGWRMYLIDFDNASVGSPETAEKSFFRYMNPQTKEIVTLEERPKLARFFKIEQEKEKLFWHCIVNATPYNRWSFGFVVPENWINRFHNPY